MSSPAGPPEPYAGFGGSVGRVFSTSEPWWPTPPIARDGAPNIIVMMADDLGFSDLGCYGSSIATPHLDRLATEGLRYTNFHVNPMCSPTRASLLTGLNHHLAGVGHVAHFDPGFPGYAMELRDDVPTLPQLLRDHGWATLMVGKWHLSKDADLSDAGPRHSWPLQKGFDRFYGFLDAFTNFHQPHRLVEDNHAIHLDQYPDGYYFTDDLTDRAVAMVRELRSSHPRKPWFLYFAHGAVHAPLQAKAADMARYRGRFDHGWDVERERRFARQRELGVVPDHAVLAPRNTEAGHAVAAWDSLTDRERGLYARYQEIYAAMVDNIDQNVGRLRAALEALGEWDNTIVIFTSDNGGSREGQEQGTSAYFRTLLAQTRETGLEDLAVDHARLDLLGGPRTLVHYPMGWAMVSCTPFRLYKINTQRGGHSVPFIVSWGARTGIRGQYQHVTDLLATICELVGIAAPATSGASFAASLDDPGAASTHPEQYYEMIGHRGFVRDGWSASTIHEPRTPFSDDVWALHDLASDPTETVDLASTHPEKVAELAAAWEEAAWANQVFPLDEGNFVKALYRPPWHEVFGEPITIYPGTPTLERSRSLSLINFRSFAVIVALAYAHGDEGVLVAHGDQGGGYALYVEGGELHYVHNAYGTQRDVSFGPLPAGAREVTLDMEAPGNLVWHATVAVDNVVVGEVRDLTVLTAMAPFEGIDVGIDRRSPVSWELYERRGTFAWSGTLHSVRYEPGELAPDAGARWLEVLKAAGSKFE